MMTDHLSAITIFGLAFLTLALGAERLLRPRLRRLQCLRPLWVFFLAFALSAWVSSAAALWLLALFSFFALREYFSLADFRLSDRLGLLAGYLSIPFMMYLALIDWYGFFIISIPVYAFLVVPFLVVLGGGEPRGTVFSIGAIDFGLFLFVYCMGHVAYLIRASLPLALVRVVAVALCDLADRLYRPGRGAANAVLKYLVCAPLPLGLWLLAAPSVGLADVHAVALGLLVPLLVVTGNFTLTVLEQDLGIAPDELEPGRGQTLDAVKSYLFAAPVVFHFLRYFTEIF